MKHVFFAAALACANVPAVLAKANLDSLEKELEIMHSILNTALKQNSSKDGIRYHSIEGRYLADQGVVYEVNTNSQRAGFAFNFNGNVVAPIPPRPPIPVVTVNDNSVFVSDGLDVEVYAEEWQEVFEDAMEGFREGMRENRERLRELAEQERELAWEQREYEREKRDYEFERRHLDEGDRKEREQELAKLNEALKSLEQRRTEIEAYRKKIEQEQKEKLTARAEAREQQLKSFLANFEANIATAMCSFGGGLRALPDNEHVSFVLPDFQLEGEGRSDRVYVFKKEDIRACVAGRLDQDKFLATAQVYQF